MAKKRSWFNLVRRLFISETESPQEKEKRRRWIFFGRMKVKSRLATIGAPMPSPPRERNRLSEAEEEQSKRALNVALATAAAAEAAVAAAHAAAEVVLLTHTAHKSDPQLKDENLAVKTESHNNPFYREKQEIAAIKIQSTFRGYLARKALRALKGIVKLQAIIRGRNVRRQAMNTLKCLQSLVNIQSQVSAKRIQMAEGGFYCEDDKHLQDLSDKIIKMDANCQRRWDGSILTKEEADALFLSKKEAAIKRERIKEYSFNHRNSAESERSKSNGRWKYWLEHWVDTQVSKSKELEDLDTIITSNPKPRVEYRGKQIKPRTIQEMMEGLDSNSPQIPPRRSFHRKQNSLGEDISISNPFTRSPVTPTYMAATESAKAKARSMSSPKLRPCPSSFDAYSESYSPCKNKLLVGTSGAGSRHGRAIAYQQRSPCLKGIATPVKSNLNFNKDLSFDSQCSLRTWDQPTNFR